MNKNEILWNMFGSSKKRKGANMPTSDLSGLAASLGPYLANTDSSEMAKQYEQYVDTATKAQMMEELKKSYAQAQAQQAQTTYGSNTALGGTWAPSVWTNQPSATPTPYVTTATSYPGEDLITAHVKQLMVLQIVNLIANVGPLVAKRIMMRYKVNFDPKEFDAIAKELSKIINGDDDPDLDKVIADTVKEVKL